VVNRFRLESPVFFHPSLLHREDVSLLVFHEKRAEFPSTPENRRSGGCAQLLQVREIVADNGLDWLFVDLCVN
jgi:hypothetical protein